MSPVLALSLSSSHAHTHGSCNSSIYSSSSAIHCEQMEYKKKRSRHFPSIRINMDGKRGQTATLAAQKELHCNSFSGRLYCAYAVVLISAKSISNRFKVHMANDSRRMEDRPRKNSDGEWAAAKDTGKQIDGERRKEIANVCLLCMCQCEYVILNIKRNDAKIIRWRRQALWHQFHFSVDSSARQLQPCEHCIPSHHYAIGPMQCKCIVHTNTLRLTHTQTRRIYRKSGRAARLRHSSP